MHGPHNWIDQDDLIAEAGGFRPDLICVVGDAVDRRGDEALVRRYADLVAPLGKFATLGNWEYQGECNLLRLRREYERAGVRLLVNERVSLGMAAPSAQWTSWASTTGEPGRPIIASSRRCPPRPPTPSAQS